MSAKYRTLGRIISESESKVVVLFPAMNMNGGFEIDRSEIPFPVKVDHRFYVQANLDAESLEELNLSDWENPEQVDYVDYEVIINFKAKKILNADELSNIRDDFAARLQGYHTPPKSLSHLVASGMVLTFSEETKQKITE